jgi:hypothetical protein
MGTLIATLPQKAGGKKSTPGNTFFCRKKECAHQKFPAPDSGMHELVGIKNSGYSFSILSQT